jgi:FlaG/FlaF family flagellin (archaellin)
MDHIMDRKILTVVIILSLIYVKCFGYLSKVSKYTKTARVDIKNKTNKERLCKQ